MTENQINNQVDNIQVILDKRIPLNLLQVSEGENVIFCKQFREELFDSGFFSTKEKDFVHKYITENNKKYIITDVSTPDGKTYKDVKFKVIVSEKSDVPFCTFNPTQKQFINEKVSLSQPILQQNETREEIASKPIKLDFTEQLQKKEQESLYLEKAKNLEKQIQIEKTRLLQEKEELKKEKENLENQKKITATIEDYKQELISDFFESTKQHEKIIKEKLFSESKNLENKINEEIDSYKKQLDLFLKDLNEKNLSLLKDELESKEFKKYVENELADNLKDYKKFLLEKFEKITSEKFENFINSKDNAFFKERIDQVLSEEKTLLEKQKQDMILELKTYTNKEIGKATDDAKNYARRILELGGGGVIVTGKQIGRAHV